MQNSYRTTDVARNGGDARNDARDNAHSRDGALTSDALGVPLLSDDPAPLSGALNIPTLLRDTPETQKADEERSRSRQSAMDSYTKSRQQEHVVQIPDASQRPPASNGTGASSNFDQFGRSRSAGEHDAPQNANRATTLAGAPREDAGSLIGVPSNHPQTEVSGRLAKLDKIALTLGAIITIGPLFAAMVSRSMG